MRKNTFVLLLLLYNAYAFNVDIAEKVVTAGNNLGRELTRNHDLQHPYNIDYDYPSSHSHDGGDFIHDFIHDDELEEKMRNGEIDIDIDMDGNPIPFILNPNTHHTSHRSLSENSAKIGTFGLLECNPSSWSNIDCSTLVSNELSTDNSLIVPCGQCYTFDMSGNVTLNGIDIKGKLHFPVNHKVVLHTPFVIVQGELDIEVSHTQISPPNMATRFVLTGTEDVMFTPSDPPNQDACEQTAGGSCNLGPKPFLVAGGKVNVNTMPDQTSCLTHTPIQKKIYKDPVYDSNAFPKFVTLPPSCPDHSSETTDYISYDFNDNQRGNWTGCDGSFLRHSNGEFTVTNRKRSNCGAELDITPIRPEICLVPHQEYLFVSRLKLEMANGTMIGEDTTCKKIGRHCVEFFYEFHNGIRATSRRKEYIHQHIAPKYGEYVHMTGTITFEEDELATSNHYFKFLMNGPESGIDIVIDSFDIFLPGETSYPDVNAVCEELVFNGDAEGNGFNPYPMVNSRSNERLKVVEEGGNKFWRLFDRYVYYSSLRYELDTTCFTRGVNYMFSGRVRYHNSNDFIGGSESYYWYIHYVRPSDNAWISPRIVECDAQSVNDGWVTCSGKFIIDEAFSETSEAYLMMSIDNSRDGQKYDLDFDDISIAYDQGYVDDLVVDTQDVSCWGIDSDIHVTSASYYSWSSEKGNGIVSQIKNLTDNGDGTSSIQLAKAATLPIISKEENSEYAVQIALLSRNVVIQGDEGEDRKGGYFQVLHTPNIAQLVQGVEFINMGRRSEVDRFALQFLYSGDIHGTVISGNSFRNSNHRCVVVEGTTNLTISQNIGHQTNGHCIYLGYHSKSNLITSNLVSDTKHISWNDRMDYETDYHPGAFVNWYGPNDYIDNIAIASERDGFKFTNHWRIRLENNTYSGSARKIKMGIFHNNVANSNAHIGFNFDHHESGQEILLKQVKAIKNKYKGFYLYASFNVTLIDGLFADNTGNSIEMRWTDNVQIKNSVVRGYTKETRTLVEPPYLNKPCISSNFHPPIGLKIPTAIHRWGRTNNLGASLTNVLFTDFDHTNECEASVPLNFHSNDNSYNHFDYLTSFQNVTINGDNIMDALTAEKESIRDIVIHDVDGSSDPMKQATQAGMFVSNVKWLKDFARDCTAYPRGISYCNNVCYRTISFMVDQFDSINFDLRITRESDNKEVLVPYSYKYDDNLHLKKYDDFPRVFSVSLPRGSYTVEFLKDLQQTWPRFVLSRWEGIPKCEGYVSKENITLIEPPSNCDNLIMNGDMELGTDYWYHRSGNSNTQYGELLAILGEGVDGSTALRHYNRSSAYAGIGQNLDTRCLHENLNEFYEIELYFRLENGTTPFICNPFNDTWEVRCPYVTFKQEKYVDDELIRKYHGRKANVVVPNNLDDFNLIHGVFKVDESINDLERLFMYLEVAHQDFDLIIDNVSVRKLPTICGDDLVRNGNFESNSKYWNRYGAGDIDIETMSSKTLKVFNRNSKYDGLYQDLYVDKSCFREKQRFKITGKFRIESAMNRTNYKCDRSITEGELECSYMNIYSESPLGSYNYWSAETIASSSNQGWNIMSGILTLNEKQATNTRIYARLYGPHKNMNIFYDDISITPVPKFCQNLVLNGDFEVGDSRFWRPSDRRYIDVHISSSGANNSQYSLTMNKYTGHSIRQTIDTQCLVEGQQFLISAKFRLLNATDPTLGVECIPSVLYHGYNTHCPTVTIRGRECIGDDLEYLFWNEIDQFQWNPNEFNNFEKAFTVGAEIASCKTVTIEIGRYIHDGRVLLVDDVQVTQRTTSAPTPLPTFSPTKRQNSGPTIHPTIKTDAPTTTNVATCPPVGSLRLKVGSGSIMIPSANNKLCTLTKVVASIENHEEKIIPVARSYNNKPWEMSPGDFAASLFKEEGILCYASGCQMNLPVLEEGAEFYLSSFTHSLSETDELARFLETATFGITQGELEVFDSSPGNVQTKIIDWVSNNINIGITPMTSHREFWRKGLNGRVPTSTSIGIADHPCDLNSRWRKISFIRNDNQWSYDKNLRVLGTGPFQLELNGWTRTIVSNFTIDNDNYKDYVFDPTFDYELCGTPEERINGRLYIRIENGDCVFAQNPIVNLDGYETSVTDIFDLPSSELAAIDEWWNNGEELVFMLQTSLFDDPLFSTICSRLPLVPELGDEPIFGKTSDGTWMIFDPRLSLESNTPDRPIDDGGKGAFTASGGETLCSNVPRTFLNENECQIGTNACKSSSNREIEILLENSTITVINLLSGQYVYAIDGLLVKYEGIVLEHPCTPGLRSRWEPKNLTDCNPTELYSGTNSSLFDLLSKSGDRNPYIRDIYFPEEGTYCNSTDTEPAIEIEVDGVCWKRVHNEHMSIFDMTYWVDKHPGGAYNIEKWSENNGTILIYPSLLESRPHGMANWNNNWHKFTYVGRFGDLLNLGDLPNDLRRQEVIDFFDDSLKSSDSKVLVCGSHGEISNVNSGGFLFDTNNGYSTTGWNTGNNRKYVWIMIALSAPDQLRQRVAWALSQILVVVKDAIGDQSSRSEMFLSYYDIFVRNAFGNYRDILKEISYNPLMAENLSFLGSKSSAYMLERYRVKTSADENFAREIMQLFTMGLVQLRMDGSPKLDQDGNTRLAYTNEDIISLSRAWTGFDLQPRRGNVEGYYNRLDPMRIIPEWRDRFPKSDTLGGYIGDRYPLCSDFPSKPFLRKGATFRLLGSSSLPEIMSDPSEFEYEDSVSRVVLDESSSLRSLLCNQDQTGKCSFKNHITLLTNYDCTGIECDIDTMRVAQIENYVFYEFVHKPCVNLAFYNNAVKISPRYGVDKVMCAEPTLPLASEACCSIGNKYATRNSKYSGERVNFVTAQNRCTEESKEICDFFRVDGDYFLNRGYFWTADKCILQVKVKRDGTVAIVHRPSDFLERVQYVSDDNENFIKVHWERGGGYPIVENNCDGVCQVLAEGSCLCNTGVIDTTVFDSIPASKFEVIDKLSIGAVDPDLFDTGTYSSTFYADINIIIHLKNNEFSAETIFEYDDDKGRKSFMKNIKSSVYLRGINSGYTGQSFKNPPHFMSLIPSETTLRDAQYETEATLDHYFYHDNTPPFIALRLIQRLVTSNPSPLYVETVANAFKSGTYSKGAKLFGEGKYGDLASTFAAIYLDDAARNVLLDADISNGSLREPILKVLALMRSMDFTSNSPVTVMTDMLGDIGQMAHEFQTVFSFFLPEFQPYGRVGSAKLVSPEATLLSMPKIIGLMNGLTSLVRFGLSNCDGGWGHQYCRERKYIPSPMGRLDFNKTSVEEVEFSFETFEGPSLLGGFDNTWVGRYFDSHNAKSTNDPLEDSNHVLHFPENSWTGDFFSRSVSNRDANGNPHAVKFRYLSLSPSSGGCIGYVDADRTYLNTQTWVFCDDDNSGMISDGNWISCQFSIPSEIQSFRIAVGDRRSPGGNAYFDDIQLASGSETTCSGISVIRKDPPGQNGYSIAVVDILSTLLTAGRLGKQSKAIIAKAFDNEESAEDGLRMAQQLILTTAEFHTTDFVQATAKPRDGIKFPEPSTKPYRAVVYVMFEGGCDSYNMLTPHTCSNGLYESYLDVRQQVALPKNQLLPISATDQVCSVFGLHPELSAIKALYDDQDLLFFANTGVLSQPVNKDNYYALTNTQLFAHNHMQRETKRIDPYETSSGTGVLGRMADVLSRDGYNVGSFSVDMFSVALVGKPGVSGSPMIVNRYGVPEVHLDDTKAILPHLHNTTQPDSGYFAEAWSASLMDSIGTNELLRSELETRTTQVEFPDTYLGSTFETISKLIATRDIRGVDVDTFYIQRGGFDTHADVEMNLNTLFSEINDAFLAYSEEMKAMSLWDNVTLIETSDFARTLNPNGGDGTDHAWGGNYMMMGGSVKGAQILGQYPEDITDDGPLTLGRGRMIPTTPWDSPFHGIASWLGINESNMDEVCPNLHKFKYHSSYLIDTDKMFDVAPSPTQAPYQKTSSPSSEPITIPSMLPSINVKQTFAPSNEPSSTPSNASSDIPTLSSVPTSPDCSPDCIGDTTEQKFTIAGLGDRSCKWALRDLDRKDERCAIPEVAENCCQSCCKPPSTAPVSTTISPAPSVLCPSDCKGDATSERFPAAGFGNVSCRWAVKKTNEKDVRCALPEVALNCCKSCCSSCIGDAAGDNKFHIPEEGIRKRCVWATKKKSQARCSLDSVSRMCCMTCSTLLPSESKNPPLSA